MALLLFGADIVLALSLGHSLRMAMKHLIHQRQYDFIDEMISTFELSACIFELGVIGRVYGVTVALFCAFCLLVAKNYNLIFQGRPANPCGYVEYALHTSTPRRQLLLLWLFQLCGALFAYPYVSIVWTLTQSSFHLDHLENGFQPELKVGVFSGFMIELFATFFSTLADFVTRPKPYDSINPWIRALTCVGIGYLMAETTGVWMNPALATAHSFQFKNDFLLEHVFVYWLGPISGAALAFLCNTVVDNMTVKKGIHEKE